MERILRRGAERPARESTDDDLGRISVQPSDRTPSQPQDAADAERRLNRAFLWIGIGIGITALGAGLGYAIFRAVMQANRPPDDPTSQRIQQLIDEANSLLKTLDEQRSSA